MPSLAEQARIVAILDKFDALTNSLTAGLPRETRAIYVGGSGDLSLLMADGSAIVLSGIVGGTMGRKSSV